MQSDQPTRADKSPHVAASLRNNNLGRSRGTEKGGVTLRWQWNIADMLFLAAFVASVCSWMTVFRMEFHDVPWWPGRCGIVGTLILLYSSWSARFQRNACHVWCLIFIAWYLVLLNIIDDIGFDLPARLHHFDRREVAELVSPIVITGATLPFFATIPALWLVVRCCSRCRSRTIFWLGASLAVAVTDVMVFAIMFYVIMMQ